MPKPDALTSQTRPAGAAPSALVHSPANQRMRFTPRPAPRTAELPTSGARRDGERSRFTQASARPTVVAVYRKDVAEAKATNATDAGRRLGYPLLLTTEPGE
jgi:hypothetical protein